MDLASCAANGGICIEILLPETMVWAVALTIVSALFVVMVFKWVLDAIPIFGG